MAMKIQPLTQADKDTIVTMARSLAGRALNAGDAQATTHAAAHSAAQARDKIAEFDQRLEMMNREVNTRLAAMSHSIEIMQRKIAGLSGDFQGVRVSLVEIETRIEQEHDSIVASVDDLVKRVMAELSTTIDDISIVASDTVSVQQELALLAQQMTKATALPNRAAAERGSGSV